MEPINEISVCNNDSNGNGITGTTVPESMITKPSEQEISQNNNENASRPCTSHMAAAAAAEAAAALSTRAYGNQRQHNSEGPTRRRNYRRLMTTAHPFLNLPAGYERRTTPQGQVYYYHKPTNMLTWQDPRIPKRYHQQNIILDNFGPLPNGWEQRTTTLGRTFFIDYNNGTTQFTDPRLNDNIIYLMHCGALSFHNNNNLNDSTINATTTINNAHNNTDTHPSNTTISIRSSNGHNDGNITMSAINNENRAQLSTELPYNSTMRTVQVLTKNRRILLGKIRALRLKLRQIQPKPGIFRLFVSRKDIFDDSYKGIMSMRTNDVRKRIVVKFKDEEGIDYGGIAREWLHLLSCEMLNAQYSLFQYSENDQCTLQINPNSIINPDQLSYFNFVGRILGICVLHGYYLNCGFSISFYKQLLNKPITLNDIEDIDSELYRSLTWMLETDITNIIETTFSINNNEFGEIVVHELKPSGSTILVTEANKHEYVQLYVNYRFMRGVEKQFTAIRQGFNELIPKRLLRSFNEHELQLLIDGISNIDVNDWRNNTRLKHCNVNTVQIIWFWQVVESYTPEMRARLLQFVTGSSRVPIQGFRALQGCTGAIGSLLFTIHLIPDVSTQNLPKAHTCFNRIDLPAYETYQLLYDKLTQAVNETCGFTIR